MINNKSIEEVNKSLFSSSFIKPLYDSYCFSNIPGTITNMFTGENHPSLPNDVFSGIPSGYDKIVFFMVDAFGWAFFEKYCDRFPILNEIVRNGTVSKLTSQFPSTTAAHVTTLHTGLPVNINGVYEWFYYEPLVDDVITPLLFCLAGDKESETLKKSGINPRDIYPKDTIYKKLKVKGIESHTFHNSGINTSTYSNILLDGANIHGYYSVPEGLANLYSLLLDTHGKAYYYFYTSEIDTIGHHYGPGSPQFEAQMDSFFTDLERIFFKNLFGKLKDTLLIISADHGQTDVDLENPVYLNLQNKKVEKYLKTNKSDNYIVPCGSYRDMFLHVEGEYIDECLCYLKNTLGGIAEVYKTRDMINMGMFGSTKSSSTFLQRVGDIVILPYKDKSVWWYEKDKFEVHMPGMHGGLTKEEVEIPFLAYPFM